MVFHKMVSVIFSFVLVVAFSSAAFASEGRPGTQGTLLEVTDLTQGGSAAAIQLDLKALEAMESVEVVTSTLWTNGVIRFQGVPLHQLLEGLDIEGSELIASAINDYSTHIPLDDRLTQHAILAYRMNGAQMSRREKGPLWIIYPYDQSPKFRTETIYARSIWQLNRIDVID